LSDIDIDNIKNFFDNSGFNQGDGGNGGNLGNGLGDDGMLGASALGGGGMPNNDQVIGNLFNQANHDFDSSKFSGNPIGGAPNGLTSGLLNSSGGIGTNNLHGI